MHFTFRPTAAGLALLALTTLPALGQTTPAAGGSAPKAAQSAAKPKAGKLGKAPKPVKAAASTPKPAAESVAPTTPVSVKRSANRAANLPNTPELVAARKQTMATRKIATNGQRPEEYLAAATATGTVVYDEFPVQKGSIADNLKYWRNHLIFQVSAAAADFNKTLSTETITVLLPTDGALVPVAPKGTISAEQLKSYIIKGDHILAELPENEPVSLETLAGESLEIMREGKEIWLTTAAKQRIPVSFNSVTCTNGPVYFLDTAIGKATSEKSVEKGAEKK